MTTCPADASNAEKLSAEQPSALGTEPAPSSGLDGLTLFERLILTEFKELNETLGYMAHLMSEHSEQGEGDDDERIPRYDLSGRPIQ